MKPEIFLCDLTYTQQTISSDVMPAAVGCLATYAEKQLGDQVTFEIFKFPDDLAAALESTSHSPRAVCFSNYCWNEDLSTQFAAVIKRHRPDIVTIFGGPNYPNSPAEQERFLRQYPQIDLYVVKEGEIAFAGLIEALIRHDFDITAVPLDCPSVHRIRDGQFIAPQSAPRIRDISEIPSPYLTGKLDRFFDGVMLPIIQTNRGCPFQCSFCVEGVDYFNKIAKTKSAQKTEAELRYIAGRMAAVRDSKGGRGDLHIADSNFGMYKEDLEICRTIAEMQREHQYPEYINVATGKNHKERVLEAAATINGALRLSGAVQSLDENVLKNIKRSNIDVQAIMDLATSASAIGANSYSEIILGLPGDTVAGHLRTIRIIVEADFNIVCLYQLMLLPGTDLASDDSVQRWGMTTKYRAIPRCFGYFNVLGEEISACEIERVCVSNASLSFDDYLACRKMHLMVNLFYNDGVFKEALRFLRAQKLPVYDWLELIYADDENENVSRLVGDFLAETKAELWDSKEDFRALTRDKSSIEKFISGELGANLIFKYRSKALLAHSDDLADVAARALRNLCERHSVSTDKVRLGQELITFGQARMSGLFSDDAGDPVHQFTFDVARFSESPSPDGDFRFPEPQTIRFTRTDEQRAIVARFLRIYGTTLPGLSRILSKVYVRRLFRNPINISSDKALHLSGRDSRFGQASLTGLNEFQ